VEIAGEYGAAVVERGFHDMVARTERRMRNAIATIPDGVYRFEDVMDDDGLGAVDIPIRLAVEVADGRIRFDFTGTAPQVRGNINVTANATKASVCYSLKALLDPEVPNNQGVLDVCEIVTESGSLLDCVTPAPVAARANTCQRIVDGVIGALKGALPDAAIGAANGANTTAVFAGRDPATGRDYLYLETLGGGFGGRNDRDGKDGVQVHITNTSNLPVEAIEMEYPLRDVSYGLIEDSGGAGRYRGGLGLRRVIAPVGHDCVFNGAGERFRNAPWGIFGGGPGAMGRFVHKTDGGERTLDIKPSGITVKAGERIVVETPGAGGYGPPAERDPAALEEDMRSGKFSERTLRENYGDIGGIPSSSTGSE
jgi:N-methylhydantoinase B